MNGSAITAVLTASPAFYSSPVDAEEKMDVAGAGGGGGGKHARVLVAHAHIPQSARAAAPADT